MTTDPLPAADPLRLDRIVGRKDIIQEDFFQIRITLTKRQQEDFIKILNCIRFGGDLEPYYRQGIGQDRDDLLMNHGVMHLHLGGKGSNALLYLLQYDDHVVLLCIDTHTHVDAKPAGKNLPILDIKKGGQIVAKRQAQEEAKEQRRKNRELVRKNLGKLKGTLLRKSSQPDAPTDGDT